MDARAWQITAALNLSGEGIEYGPLDKPLLPQPHYSVSYVDYADRTNLADRYQSNKNRDVDRIQEVDIVTAGKHITEFLAEESIDYVVASHVLEHVPDLLGWLESNLRVLRPGGRIALAFPDKRYCFDLRRNSSGVSDILAAYLEQRTRPTLQQVCDQIWNASRVTAADCWDETTTPANADYIHPRKSALEILRTRAQSEDYYDCHCWVFSDVEFLDAMTSLRNLSAVGYEVVSFLPTKRGRGEFFTTLERAGG